ncbi:glycoside hydrolase family 19 protein [Herbaspirillum rubrisubalbicans]|uniref:Pyocin R, lytic enzyme n=1 Tax=Herbaspirillum rubrisubalbicans TaxID=80842 RepID=A0AAD0U6N8_9BURK|nr:glycoside hydrolase family 19 protein [Herbaspirillum rubrisubalbicans]AYR24272.1 pyocin R, lytic enzyme [Herbaspirillum rubrisubalbicans]
MILTLAQLQRIMPASTRASLFLKPLNAAMQEFGIDTRLRMAAFLSQIGHESGQFRFMEELASGAAYDNRADLGNTNPEAIRIATAHGSTPGRFWKGHGPIQITGYHNHLAAMLALHVDCVEQPRLLCEPVHGCRAAGWFWSVNGLAKWADAGDIDGVSDLVNRGKKTVAIGDANGFAERKAIWERALEVIS